MRIMSIEYIDEETGNYVSVTVRHVGGAVRGAMIESRFTQLFFDYSNASAAVSGYVDSEESRSEIERRVKNIIENFK
jgi:hypothetical protein